MSANASDTAAVRYAIRPAVVSHRCDLEGNFLSRDGGSARYVAKDQKKSGGSKNSCPQNLVSPPPPEKGPKWGKTVQISRKSSKLTLFFGGGGETQSYGQNDFMDIWAFLKRGLAVRHRMMAIPKTCAVITAIKVAMGKCQWKRRRERGHLRQSGRQCFCDNTCCIYEVRKSFRPIYVWLWNSLLAVVFTSHPDLKQERNDIGIHNCIDSQEKFGQEKYRQELNLTI